MQQRIHIVIRGAVQGVGFRPFIYRLAQELGLTGWVLNSLQGVFIEGDGPKELLEQFLLRIEKERPPRSSIQSLEFSFLDPAGFTSFEILESVAEGEATALVLPDIATCPDCIHEVFDPANRRYRYPFTNCTNCGPRFTIIEALPYDRPATSMKRFVMCDECRHEYESPLDRRFHAQPNACPKCGPQLELWDHEGHVLHRRDDALRAAAHAINEGRIVAVKGIGGFHLMVDAGNEKAVMRLRKRKHREEKPLAVMFPSPEAVEASCRLNKLERRFLVSPEAPIVLLERIQTHPDSQIAPAVAPRNPYLGVMVPYSPLHHLLLSDIGSPVVATSGNISDEPICTDERDALGRLVLIADMFLVHNRPIVRHVDDSIGRIMLGRELVLRRARGYAPLPITLRTPMPDALAVGAHLKNTIAISRGESIFISQHIGDLETEQSFRAFRTSIEAFRELYNHQPQRVVSDLHPDYLSSQYARGTGLPLITVQHHYAHVASCMAENELEGELLGVSWDGTGYGLDGTIWGGEFLLTGGDSFQRVATFRQFPLPGGEMAIREPRRAAVGLLFESLGDPLFTMDDLSSLGAFSGQERAVLRQMLVNDLNSPSTSSAGRLFDAVASIIGLRHRSTFEGQAAMELEFAAAGYPTEEAYEFRISEPGLRSERIGAGSQESRIVNAQSHMQESQPALVIDWSPMVNGVINDAKRGVGTGIISAKFHNTLAEIILKIAEYAGQNRVALSGGCFQNKLLTERTVHRLESEGFRTYCHQRVPPNDGGISLGQLYALSRTLQRIH